MSTLTRSLLVLVTVTASALPVDAQATTTLVSRSPGGAPGNGNSAEPFLSDDGRWVAFTSGASNLVAGDTNGKLDVFLTDLQVGATVRISVGPGGVQANGDSLAPTISGDGRWVVFESDASNLVPGDTNTVRDVFLHDALTGVTTKVSNGLGGAPADGTSRYPAISADGSTVAFVSWASNLVTGDTNNRADVFAQDLASGVTQRVNLTSTGNQSNSSPWFWVAVSGDGQLVAFSTDDGLVPADTNGEQDVYLFDRVTSTTEWVSLTESGGAPNGPCTLHSISRDGERVLFYSAASNLVAGIGPNLTFCYRRDRAAGTTTVGITKAAGSPVAVSSIEPHPVESADGRYVLFHSSDCTLVPGDSNPCNALGGQDVFVQDKQTGIFVLVSRNTDGTQANAASWSGSLSADGSRIVFESEGASLVTPPTNGLRHILLHERLPGTPTSYCTAKVNSQGCTPTISGNGIPSASSGLPFLVESTNVINQSNGLLFYGFAPAYAPFQKAYLCVQAPPVRRTTPQSSGGNPPPNDCSGSFAIDFNAWIQTSGDPLLVPGTGVYAQYWYRDVQYPVGPRTGLSAGLEFVIQP